MTACEAGTPLNADDRPATDRSGEDRSGEDRSSEHLTGEDRADDSYRPLNVVDVVFFAPIGLALRAGTLIPEAIENGRKEYEKRRATANLLGTFIVAQHRRKRRLAAAQKAAGTPGDAHLDPEPTAQRGGVMSQPRPTVNRTTGVRVRAEATQPEAATSGSASHGSASHGSVTSGSVTSDSAAEAVVAQSGAAVPALAELPIDGYDTLPARSLIGLFDGLTAVQRAAVARYERAHRRRETVLTKLRQLDADGEIDQPG